MRCRTAVPTARTPSRRRVPCARERRGETSSAAVAAVNSRRFIRSSSQLEDDGTHRITSRWSSLPSSRTWTQRYAKALNTPTAVSCPRRGDHPDGALSRKHLPPQKITALTRRALCRAHETASPRPGDLRLPEVHASRGASSTAKQVPEHCGEQNACLKFSSALVSAAPRRPLSPGKVTND